jgi:DNA-binding response OmpR family regulator
MTLESMVVSRDWQEVSVLECILGGMQIGVDVETEPEEARRKLSLSKIDAVIVDYDLPGADSLVRKMQPMRQGDDAIPLVLMSGPRHHDELRRSGADFFFEKPLSVEQAVHTLAAARNLILRGRLRYHRHALQAEVLIVADKKRAGKKTLDAELVNVSQGGIGVRIAEELQPGETLQLRFSLPGRALVVEARAAVAWRKPNGYVGLRFEEIAAASREELQLWLAGRYFES